MSDTTNWRSGDERIGRSFSFTRQQAVYINLLLVRQMGAREGNADSVARYTRLIQLLEEELDPAHHAGDMTGVEHLQNIIGGIIGESDAHGLWEQFVK